LDKVGFGQIASEGRAKIPQKGDENMKNIKDLTDELYREIKKQQKEIDNPALVLSILSELDFFKNNVKD